MKLHTDAQTDDVQIQIVPLIDVIFCILTFFILASLQLTRQQGINLDLPKAATGQVQMREMLVVTIDSAGQTYVDKQLIDRGQLYQAIKTYHEQNPDGLLVLNAAQTAFYNDVVQVLDILRSVGGDRVALATAPQASGATPAASPNPLAPEGVSPGGTSTIPGISPVPSAAPTLPSTGFPNPNGLNSSPNGFNPTPGLGTNPAPVAPGATAPNPLIVPSAGSGNFPTPQPSPGASQ